MVVFILAMLLGGCITSGGKKLTGVVPTGHGTYRLQQAVDREKREAAAEAQKKAEEARRKALLEAERSKQVKLPPARVNPVIPAPQSAKAVDVPIKIAPADSKTPFKPSVSKTSSLSPADALIEDLKSVGNEENKIVINGEEKDREVKAKMTINWMKLIGFYLGAAILLGGAYFGLKAAKKRPSTRKKTTKKHK